MYCKEVPNTGDSINSLTLMPRALSITNVCFHPEGHVESAACQLNSLWQAHPSWSQGRVWLLCISADPILRKWLLYTLWSQGLLNGATSRAVTLRS